MKKATRLLALLLAMLMVLTACGGGNDSKGGDDTPAAPSNTDTPDNTDAPAVDLSETMEVSIFQQADDVTFEEVENNPVTLYWKDMFNLDIEWQLPPQGSEQEQLTMMLGTGDYTDLINLDFYTDSVAALAEDGVIYELSSYIEQYMPNYYAYLNDPANADVKSILYDDQGHIYNMAVIKEHPKAWGGLDRKSVV